MGLWDKAKAAAVSAKDAAIDAAGSKIESVKAQQVAKRDAAQAAKDAQAEMASVFSATHTYGRIEVDQTHGLLKVIGPVEDIPKQESGLVKGARAIGALYTLGASLAVESAMRNKPFYLPVDMLRGYEAIRDDETTIGAGSITAQSSGWGIGAAVGGGVGLGFGRQKTKGKVGERKVKRSVSLLTLRLDLKSLDLPCIYVPYITNDTSVKSGAYQKAVTEMQTAAGALDILLGM